MKRHLLTLAITLTLPLSVTADDKETAAEAKAKDVKLGALTLSVPPTWKQEPPANRLRLGQFVIPAAKGHGPGELVVSHFGGGGGGVKANVERWIGQFSGEKKTKTMQGQSKQGAYVIVSITGTFNKPIGPPIRRQTKATPGSQMLGVILHIEGEGNYFLKLTGDEATVTAAADQLRNSFGADSKKETALELD